MDDCTHRTGIRGNIAINNSLKCTKLTLKEQRFVRIQYYCSMIERLRAVDHIQPESYCNTEGLMTKWAKCGDLLGLQVGEQMGLNLYEQDLEEAVKAGHLNIVEYFLSIPSIIEELWEPCTYLKLHSVVSRAIRSKQIGVLKLFDSLNVHMDVSECITLVRTLQKVKDENETDSDDLEFFVKNTKVVSYKEVLAYFEDLAARRKQEEMNKESLQQGEKQEQTNGGEQQDDVNV